MRIITRPDFDGIVCAVLLYDALDINEPTKWVEPNDMQNQRVNVHNQDVIANLASHEKCLLWFDHHESNTTDKFYNGAFRIAPSAAGLVFEYFNRIANGQEAAALKELTEKGVKIKPFHRDFTDLVKAADKIDSANLTPAEVLHPEKYPYIAISMAISSHKWAQEPFWNRLVELLRKYDVEKILRDPEVKERCESVCEANRKYAATLLKHTEMTKKVTVTDFRDLAVMPPGNRFMVFSLFPESVVNVKIRYHDEDREQVIVSVGHSIFNRNCNVSCGRLCTRYSGGGHRGAGSCSFHIDKADEYIPAIIETLLKDEEIPNNNRNGQH